MAELAALGVVLGVLPLIVSAIEDYENVCRPIGHYRNYALESIKVQQKLGIEKAIFINECKLLLQTTLSSTSLANQMVADIKHAAWKDQGLNETLTKCIANYEGYFNKIIEDIRAQVLGIEHLCQEYGILDKEVVTTSTSKSPQTSHSNHRQWLLHVGKKLKYSFGASGLQEKLLELEGSRQLFVDVSSQIRESIKLSSAHALPAKQTNPGSPKTSGYEAIQEASKGLYAALEEAWDCHDEHSLHVRLDTNQVSKSSRIRFHLGLRLGNEQGPTWVAIESICKTSEELLPQTTPLQCPIAKQTFMNAFGIQDMKQRSIHVESVSRVRIQRSSAWHCPWSEDIESKTTQQFDPSHMNISIRSKICHQLQQHFDGDIPSPESEKCLGVLEPDSKYHHLVYTTFEQHSTSQSPVSLSHFMSPDVRQSPLGDFNLYEKFRLARQLSEAVLHYHPTPVMKAPWASEDVVFFGNDFTAIEQRPSVASPHLKVQIRNRHALSHSEQGIDDESFSPRNPHLFALALLLFEIGYQTSIEDLHRQFRSSMTHSDKQRHYNLVQKVCKNFMSAKTGIPYKVIVYKCLNCDFGIGEDDLSSSVLQRAFYEHVVCALEKLEKEQEEIYGAELS
ncbi:uncharacterized protein LY89DRAFT_685593 [Mollisia scopiformis]|uniref:DUF7580 domain-containing protein n=1 Tax=Mollisia scopiformis TaxID=149040 RepID=A0A194X6E4_MOLSC|nr:uncharacterized protein LY89DRAFT_685593 [Mollisia scopiformis]KUJ15639.1 hypothetical protein LY89DRAFT_685593 [Mollisia scopiformis]